MNTFIAPPMSMPLFHDHTSQSRAWAARELRGVRSSRPFGIISVLRIQGPIGCTLQIHLFLLDHGMRPEPYQGSKFSRPVLPVIHGMIRDIL